MSLYKILLFATIFCILSACVVRPNVTSSYDNECQIVKKKVQLSMEQVQAFHGLNCSSNNECKTQFLGQIVGATLVLPLSAIISGSIAVVGNTMYWLSEQGQCLKKD